MHDLALSAAAKLNAGMNSARTALLMTVFMPRPLSRVHAEIQQQTAPIGNGPKKGINANLARNGVELQRVAVAIEHTRGGAAPSEVGGARLADQGCATDHWT